MGECKGCHHSKEVDSATEPSRAVLVPAWNPGRMSAYRSMGVWDDLSA